MRYAIVLLFFLAAILQCCNSTTNVPNEDSLRIRNKIADTLPHEVRKGRVATYAYTPDTAVRQLILGNSESFRLFYRDNGANINQMEQERMAISYFNSIKTEEVQLLLTENEKDRDVIYSITVQKYGDAGSPILAKKPLTTATNNYITGNGIYIGMSQEYVMHIYADQALTQWQKGDTLFLQFHPMEKDQSYFKRYSWKSYKATYKFVEDQLVRMEMEVDPNEFEK